MTGGFVGPKLKPLSNTLLVVVVTWLEQYEFQAPFETPNWIRSISKTEKDSF